MIQGRRQNWRDGVHRRQKDLNSIQTRLQELEKACAQKAGKAPILVLRGFPSALCREFLQSPWAVFPADEVLDEEGWLRPEAVAKAATPSKMHRRKLKDGTSASENMYCSTTT